MKAYGIDYTYKGHRYWTTVDARDLKSAKNKIGRKHGLKASEADAIKITNHHIIGYF